MIWIVNGFLIVFVLFLAIFAYRTRVICRVNLMNIAQSYVEVIKQLKALEQQIKKNEEDIIRLGHDVWKLKNPDENIQQ